MIGGFTGLIEVLRRNHKKEFRWVADLTPYAVHQDNALISTSKGPGRMGKVFESDKELKLTT